MTYSGIPQEKRGNACVDTLSNQKWKRTVMPYGWISERMLTVRYRMPKGKLSDYWSVYCVYTQSKICI
jgi:hypothetical protein